MQTITPIDPEFDAELADALYAPVPEAPRASIADYVTAILADMHRAMLGPYVLGPYMFERDMWPVPPSVLALLEPSGV